MARVFRPVIGHTVHAIGSTFSAMDGRSEWVDAHRRANRRAPRPIGRAPFPPRFLEASHGASGVPVTIPAIAFFTH